MLFVAACTCVARGLLPPPPRFLPGPRSLKGFREADSLLPGEPPDATLLGLLALGFIIRGTGDEAAGAAAGVFSSSSSSASISATDRVTSFDKAEAA